jgi:anti-anti-sigma regulatory factor
VVDLSQVRSLASAGVGVVLSAAHNTDGIRGSLHLISSTENPS